MIFFNFENNDKYNLDTGKIHLIMIDEVQSKMTDAYHDFISGTSGPTKMVHLSGVGALNI